MEILTGASERGEKAAYVFVISFLFQDYFAEPPTDLFTGQSLESYQAEAGE